MTELHREDSLGDPFGSTAGERIWRRLAGAGLAVMVAAAGFTLWTTEVLPWVTFGALVVYILGVPVSWAVTRHGGAPVRRHTVAAIIVGILVAAVLSRIAGGLVGWAIFALFSVGIGAPLAALAVWSGLALPARWVRPVAVGGLLVTATVLPFGTWLEQRPPAPYDFVVVYEPDAVRRHFRDAHALAEAIAERFEELAGAGHARTVHATWVAVGQDLSDQELENISSGMRFTSDRNLPTLKGRNEPVRLVTTIFDDEPTRGCVIVTSATSRAEPQACDDLSLTN